MKVKPVQFKFGDYLNGGYELLKKDYGNFILAYLFCAILSIVPFCGLMAMGNFYKYCKKVHHNEQANPADIFNFDDFSTYIMLNLILIAIFIVGYIPMMFLMPGVAFLSDGNETAAGIVGLFGFIYFFAFFIAVFIIIAKAFYMPAFISLRNIKDYRQAWTLSNIMTKNNLLMIILFSIVASFLGQIGVILCGIGIFLTAPFMYTSTYIAYDDALKQIDDDEIKEIIGQNTF